VISNPVVWSLLGLSIVSEVIGTVSLRHSDGFAKPLAAVIAGACYVLAVWLMAIVMRQLEMGLTYAVWAAGGTTLTAVLGMAVYGESASVLKLAGLGLVVAGVVLLNLAQR
jgi:small multidrug resistance pump